MSEKRCNVCILPESYPDIRFNPEGTCNLCNTYEEPKVKGLEELRKLIDSVKGEKYDCAVTVSGGGDSTFMLYFAAKVLGLRVLGITFDNGFQHEQAYKNVKEASTRLETDLLEVKSEDNLNARLTAAALHMAIPFGPGPCLHFLCRHCYNGGRAFLYSSVYRHKIPIIFWGDATTELLSFAEKRKQVFGFKSPIRYALSSRAFSFLEFLYLLYRQREEAELPENKFLDFGLPQLKDTSVLELHLFDYIPWDRREIEQVITEELGWQKPPEALIGWHSDCHLHHIVNYCHKKAIGSTHDIDGLSNMIRAGCMDRSTAIDLIDKGIDAGEWGEEHERVVRDILHLSESDIATMKSW